MTKPNPTPPSLSPELSAAITAEVRRAVTEVLSSQAAPLAGQDRIMRLPEVETITGLKRSSIYAFIANGAFPSGIPLGANSVGWLASEVQSWIAARAAARKEAA